MVLENEFLRAEIIAKGAELKSLVGKENNHEYLWRADPTYWAKTSPVLFPIVGALKDDMYIHQGESYRLPRHGFARDLIFEESLISSTEAVFTLLDTVETRKVYPFAFRLSLRYKLLDSVLVCTYEVINTHASDTLLFSIGGHPAFAAAQLDGDGPDYEDHYLEFPNDEVLRCHQTVGGLISERIKTISLMDKQLLLNHELFYSDALVMKTLQSKQITLRNRANGRGIHFSHENFPYFGIWAAMDADFVCLEPWCGIADQVGHNQQLEEKEGIQQLEAGKTWERSWEVACF